MGHSSLILQLPACIINFCFCLLLFFFQATDRDTKQKVKCHNYTFSIKLIKFHQADSRVLLQLCKSLVLPTLDYCSSLWDPHYAIYSKKLESVQTFAARIISKSWRSSSSNLSSSLQLPSLSVRRRKQKVALAYCIINNLSIIPIIPSFFIPHPSPHLRHNHSLPLYCPPIHSTFHLSSFSVSVVPLWNRLSSELVMPPPPPLFKQRFKELPFL